MYLSKRIIPCALLLLASSSAHAGLAETTKIKKVGFKDGDQFGYSLAVEGDRAIAGAMLDEILTTNKGAAFVFERDSFGLWIQQAKLVASDGHLGDQLGNSVALSGDRAIVGAWNLGAGTHFGGAYIFERDAAGGWPQVAKLLPADGGNNGFFGVAVAMDGDRAAVAANYENGVSTVYLYERAANGTWGLTQEIATGSGFLSVNGPDCSLALHGDRLVFGTPMDADFAFQAGAVYVFDRNASGSFVQTVKLHANDGSYADVFGSSVALEGDRIAVGAPGDDDLATNSGACYVFERGFGGLWIQKAKLKASDAVASAIFGQACDLDGDKLLVSNLKTAAANGHAYVFERNAAGTWNQSVELSPTEPTAGFFGRCVAFAGDQILVGANTDDKISGSIHVFQDCTGHFANYGAGCPGTGAFVPALTVNGCLQPGAYFRFTITKGLGLSPAFLFLGLTQGAAPLGGGCPLLVAPLVTMLPLGSLAGPGPGNGVLWLETGLPATMASPTEFTMQALVLDPGAILGAVVSNGVDVTIE